MAGVSKRVGQLLAEERVALGTLADERGDAGRQGLDPERPSDQGLGVVGTERAEREPEAAGSNCQRSPG